MEHDFEQFWQAYPKAGKKAKAACERKWGTLLKNEKLPPMEELLDAVETYKNSRNVGRGYVAHALTWLNQGRWADEYDEDEENPLAQVFNMEEWRSRLAHPSSHAAGRS